MSTVCVQFPIWSTEKMLSNLTGERKYEQDKEGRSIKTGYFNSCWLIQKLQGLEAACWISACFKALGERSLQFCLSKHIQPGPFFDPLLTFSLNVYSFKLNVWSIVSVVKGWQHRDHQSEGNAQWPLTAGEASQIFISNRYVLNI